MLSDLGTGARRLLFRFLWGERKEMGPLGPDELLPWTRSGSSLRCKKHTLMFGAVCRLLLGSSNHNNGAFHFELPSAQCPRSRSSCHFAAFAAKEGSHWVEKMISPFIIFPGEKQNIKHAIHRAEKNLGVESGCN